MADGLNVQAVGRRSAWDPPTGGLESQDAGQAQRRQGVGDGKVEPVMGK